MASDLTPEYIAVLRRMTGEQKLRAAARVYCGAAHEAECLALARVAAVEPLAEGRDAERPLRTLRAFLARGRFSP